MQTLAVLPLNINGGNAMNEAEEVIDMDVLDDLCDRYGIRRNQRVSTLMDAIDEALDVEPEDEGDDDDD